MSAAPQTISWNLTQRCNLGCAHCYLDAGLRQGLREAELDTAACLAVLEQIRALSPECLLILTGGEPLLRRDLEVLCRHAAGLGLWVVLGTNGTLLTAERAAGLRQCGVKGVGISLDSLHAHRHDAFRGRAGAWNGAVAGLQAARVAGLDAVLQVSLMPWNVEEIEALLQFGLEQGVRAVNFYFLVCTGRGQRETPLSADAAEGIYARLHAVQRHYAGRVLVNAKCAPQYQRFVHRRHPDSEHLHAFPVGCPAASSYCRIDPQGAVTPCPYIPSSGGNVFREGLARIWREAAVFRDTRDRAALRGRCGVCDYRQVCGGCRARALAQHGDLSAEDPSCAYQPPVAPSEPIRLSARARYGEVDDDVPDVVWSPDALASLARVPPFVRPMVRRRMEQYAAQAGQTVISNELLQAMRLRVRTRLGLTEPAGNAARGSEPPGDKDDAPPAADRGTQ
ncbi:MAG: radical SAM protein [Candidatus Lambdaproteobacteria bacterium]|nr:radical SAM protein [Candidatus Lambdaproteobacteria bacterium]